MSDIKLSFCIPTYNRANYIGQTLSSMADQIVEGGWTNCIEICVCDNASTDNTDEVICHFQAKNPSVKLIYSRNSENLGADRNYLRVVELATGDYCWLFGSDDTLAPGAVCRILSEFDLNLDIYLCNRINCDINLKPGDKFCGLKISNDRIFDFSLQGELRDYFNSARSIYAVFSYLSSIIVKRSQWNSVDYDTSMTGTAYSHAYILVALIANSAQLKYLQDAMVHCRFGNDSFALDGEHTRYMLDFVGYSKIASKLFENDNIKYSFVRILTRQYPWYQLIKFRYFYKDKWHEDKSYFRSSGYSKLTIVFAEIIGSLPYLCVLILILKRTFSRLIEGVAKDFPFGLKRKIMG